MKIIYILSIFIQLLHYSGLTAQTNASLLIKWVNCSNSYAINLSDSISLFNSNRIFENSGDENNILKLYSDIPIGEYKCFYRSSEIQQDSILIIPIMVQMKYILEICPATFASKLKQFTPLIDQININESYLVEIFTEGCFVSNFDSFRICRKSDYYEIITSTDTLLLKENDIEDIRIFDYQLNGCADYGCTTTEKYIIRYNDLSQEYIEGSCLWRPYSELRKKIYNRK